MFTLIELTKEHDINKVVRQVKNNYTHPITMLFTSLWDEPSTKLLEKLSNTYEANEWNSASNSEPLYVVNSFDTPHSFVIFDTTKVPTLININEEGVLKMDYLPHIYKFLGIK